MEVKKETTMATRGGRKTEVFTPETGNSIENASGMKRVYHTDEKSWFE
jgi:hypothetical protein